eukprot:tig00000076_g2412.t1
MTSDVNVAASAATATNVRDKTYFWWGSRSKNCRTPAASNAEERNRLRDVCIVACQELDKHDGLSSTRTISDGLLTHPRSDYEDQAFVRAIREGQLVVEEDGDPWDAVRRFLKTMGSGRFVWRRREMSTTCRPTSEEAVRARDCLAIICMFVDEKTGWQPRLREEILNHPRSRYEGDHESFYAALQRGKFKIPTSSSSSPNSAQDQVDFHALVYAFFERHGGPLKPSGGSTRTLGARCDSKKTGASAANCIQTPKTESKLKTFKFACPSACDPEEAARILDRFIITCQELDKLTKRPPEQRISDSKLNFPREEYAKEEFFDLLQRGKLAGYVKEHETAPAAGHEFEELDNLREAVRHFLKDCGVIKRFVRKRTRARSDAEEEEDKEEDEEEDEDEEDEDEEDEDEEDEEEEDENEDGDGDRIRARSRVGQSGYHCVLRFKKRFWRGKFMWRREYFSSASSLDPKDAAQFRDRAIICCQWLDKHEGIPETSRIPDAQLNFKRSKYEKEKFYLDLHAGKLEGYVETSEDAKSYRKRIRKFLANRGAYQTRARSTVQPSTASKDEESGELEATQVDECEDDEDGDGDEEAGSSADEAESSADEDEIIFKGIRRDKRGFPGYFAWRDMQFSTPGVSSTMEEAARLRDRHMVTCQYLDKAQRIRPILTCDSMNFPKNDYKEEPFFKELQRGKLKAPKGKATYAAARCVREFLAEMGVAPYPKRPKAAAVATLGGSARAEDEESSSDEESDDESFAGHQNNPEDEATAAIKAHWRELHSRGKKIADSVVRLDGRYYATFFLENEKAISPPLASVDDALHFVDRCRIAWCGPDGERRYGMEINMDIEDYTSEAWYQRLFEGPEGQRPKVGDNDPDWNADHAAAVRRTVAFVVEAELELRAREQKDAGAAAGGGVAGALAATAGEEAAGGDRETHEPALRPAKKQRLAAVDGDTPTGTQAADKAKGRGRASDQQPAKKQKTAGAAAAGTKQTPRASPAAEAAPSSHREAAAAAAAAAPKPAAAPINPAPPVPPVEAGPPAAAPVPVHVASPAVAPEAAGQAVASASGPPAPKHNPSALLEWEAPEVLQWLVERLGLKKQPRACRVLGRLALTGRMLLMRSAAGLRPRLMKKLGEEIAEGGADTKLEDVLEAAFEFLDDEARACSRSSAS